MKRQTILLYTYAVACTACAAFYLGCSSNNSNQNVSPHVACQDFTLTCQNGGQCGEKVTNGYIYTDTCTCPTGYDGTVCENVSRTKFIGTWVGSAATSPPIVHDTIVITAGATIAQLYLIDKHDNGNGSEGADTVAMSLANFFNGDTPGDINRQGYFTDTTYTTLVVVRTDLVNNIASQFTGTKL